MTLQEGLRIVRSGNPDDALESLLLYFTIDDEAGEYEYVVDLETQLPYRPKASAARFSTNDPDLTLEQGVQDRRWSFRLGGDGISCAHDQPS